jgi:hypothetical protein
MEQLRLQEQSCGFEAEVMAVADALPQKHSRVWDWL